MFSQLATWWKVVAAMEYARRQEYGFQGTDRLGRTFDQAGSHYMQRAADKERRGHARRIKEAIRSARPR